MQKEKVLVEIPPNYNFVILSSLVYSFFLHVVLNWIFHVHVIIVASIISIVIIIFVQFSIYKTCISKSCIYQKYLLRFISREKVTSNIVIDKISFRVTTVGTYYFHIYYKHTMSFS
jgi:hypothetical protein